MKIVDITIVGDGSSDRCLVPITEWIIGKNFPNTKCRIEYANDLPKGNGGLSKRLSAALHFYPCHILVVHRDAEREDPQARFIEIRQAAANANDVAVVPAVPVRMTEAWLLLSEPAIRRASNNPNGNIAINLPDIRRVENLPNPKEILFSLVREASGLKGRRLNKLNINRARERVAYLIGDYSPLRAVPSFLDFERKLCTEFRRIG